MSAPKNGNRSGSEKFRLGRFQMKNRMPGRAEKFSRRWQQIRRPRARRDHDRVAANATSIFEQNSFDRIVAFVAPGNLRVLAQFDA